MGMNIFQKLAKITAEIGTVAKNLSVTAGKNNSYKAVSERDILDAVKPIEEKYGVYSYPVSRETLASDVLESESTYQGNTTKKTTFYCRIKTIYRFVNTEDPSDFVETTVFSVGMDSQDKGDGKAMTYADKYALMKMYKISTGDDPDQDGSVDADYRRARKPLPQCEKCGGGIMDVMRRDGTTMTKEDLIALSFRDFGKQLCAGCYKAMRRDSKDEGKDR